MDGFALLPAWVQALAATGFTYAMTAAGAACVFFARNMRGRALPLAEGLAAGVMLAASFFSLLLPAMERTEAAGAGRAAVVLTAGFLAGGAVIMVAGNQPYIPSSILDGVRTMTTNIVLEMGYATDLHREALIATAVVLFVFILLINALFAVIKRRMK